MNKPSKQVKETIKFYDTHSAEYADKIDPLAPTFVIDKFVSLLTKGKVLKALDVGCGAGRDSRELQSRGLEVIGIDLSKGLLEEAKKRSSGIKFEYMDMRHLKFKNNYFNGIYASASLLHLATMGDVKKTLKEFYRVSKRKGILHIRVKAKEKKEKSTNIVKEKLSGDKPRFFRYFTEEELKKLVKDTGFSLMEVFTYNGQDINPSWRKINWIVLFAKKIR